MGKKALKPRRGGANVGTVEDIANWQAQHPELIEDFDENDNIEEASRQMNRLNKLGIVTTTYFALGSPSQRAYAVLMLSPTMAEKWERALPASDGIFFVIGSNSDTYIELKKGGWRGYSHMAVPVADLDEDFKNFKTFAASFNPVDDAVKNGDLQYDNDYVVAQVIDMRWNRPTYLFDAIVDASS
jgi:hypothetical protein